MRLREEFFVALGFHATKAVGPNAGAAARSSNPEAASMPAGGADRGVRTGAFVVRLTALTMMKIEGDIVEEFVRHTLRFVDHLIVVDNGSLDAASEILSELRSEGLPVTIWAGEPVASRTDVWTALARRAFTTFETDYLLMLDVDEFVRAPSRATLEQALGALGDAHGLVPWVTYVPTPDDDPDEPRVLARVRHRLRRESHPHGKVFVHRSFMQDPGALLLAGNHAIFHPRGNPQASTVTGVELAHIPVRSHKQIQSKALLGWPQFLAMGLGSENGIAYQWRRLNDRLLNDPDWNADDFFPAAWHYLDQNQDGERPEFVFDPLPTTERRYPHAGPELLALAVAFTRQFALAYAARAPHIVSPSREIEAMADIETPHDLLTEDLQNAAPGVEDRPVAAPEVEDRHVAVPDIEDRQVAAPEVENDHVAVPVTEDGAPPQRHRNGGQSADHRGYDRRRCISANYGSRIEAMGCRTARGDRFVRCQDIATECARRDHPHRGGGGLPSIVTRASVVSASTSGPASGPGRLDAHGHQLLEALFDEP